MEVADVYPHIEELKKKNSNPSPHEIKEQQERSKIALNRMNELHSKYSILNGDFLYTLSLFIIEPIKWINKYEWRQLEPIEKNVSRRLSFVSSKRKKKVEVKRKATGRGKGRGRISIGYKEDIVII